MESKPRALPSESNYLDEIDALKIQNFQLRIALAKADLKDLSREHDAYLAGVLQKYAIDPKKDRIDIKTRSILRGKEGIDAG